MATTRVIPVERLDLRYAPRPWPFAQTRRGEIDAHFAKLQAERPALFNGPVLLAYDCDFIGRTFAAAFFDSDFASFMAWRDWSFPDQSVTNCFAMAALQSSDGAFLLGVMGDHTSNPGHIYFPSGTPDPDDITGARVDFEGSVLREVAEETGLSDTDLDLEPGWHAVVAGARIAMIKTMQVPETAARARARILGYLAREERPELCDIRIVRGPGDLDPLMPNFVTAFLAESWK